MLLVILGGFKFVTGCDRLLLLLLLYIQIVVLIRPFLCHSATSISSALINKLSLNVGWTLSVQKSTCDSHLRAMSYLFIPLKPESTCDSRSEVRVIKLD